MKIVFAGTTEFGIPTLEKLKKSYELVLVITQSDKPTGRKQVLTASPIKLWAQKNNIPVIQPDKILDSKLQILDPKPDLLLVAAYGQIIPKEILDLPKFGSVNIHGSLLPKYRGASPIQAAILNGDTETGITLIKMDEKMDHGQVIAKDVVRLNGQETYPELYQTLSHVAAELVERVLPDWFAARIKIAEQVHSMATFTKMLSKSDGKIDWTKPAKIIDQQIRALNPEPGTWTTLDGKVVKILSSEPVAENKIELVGKIYTHGAGIMAVKCVEGALLIKQIQPEGKSPMSGRDFLNGLKSGSKMFV